MNSRAWFVCLIVLLAVLWLTSQGDSGRSVPERKSLANFSVTQPPEFEPWAIERQFPPLERPYFEPGPDSSVLVFNTLCLVGVDGLDEMYVRVLQDNLAAASGLFEDSSTSKPSGGDFVYVLGTDHEPAAFRPLAFVQPDREFQHNGRVFATEAGPTNETLLVRDTGGRFVGSPNAVAMQEKQ